MSKTKPLPTNDDDSNFSKDFDLSSSDLDYGSDGEIKTMSLADAQAINRVEMKSEKTADGIASNIYQIPWFRWSKEKRQEQTTAVLTESLRLYEDWKKKTAQQPYLTDLRDFPNSTSLAKDIKSSESGPWVKIYGGDSVRAAAAIHNETKGSGTLPCILNLANEWTPGSTVKEGICGPEEMLCVKTTLLYHLRPEFYNEPCGVQEDGSPKTRLAAHNAIMTPEVIVWSRGPGFKLGDENIFHVDVVSMSAPYQPDIETVVAKRREVEVYRDVTVRKMFADKLSALLRALRDGNRTKRLIIGDFGHGTYGNPVFDVARILKEVLFDTGEDWHTNGLEEVIIVIDRIREYRVWQEATMVFRKCAQAHIDDDGEEFMGRLDFVS